MPRHRDGQDRSDLAQFYEVEMGTIIRDIAKSFRWVYENIAKHGGDSNRIFVMGHSANQNG